MKKFLEEFKAFAMRGNVMDLAVGVIVGGAFSSITNSLINDIIMPVVGIFVSEASFADLAVQVGPAVITYGNFIQAVINFLITALVIFCIVKGINALGDRLKKKEEAAPEAPKTKKCPYCLSEIAVEAVRCPHCTSHLEGQQ